MSISGSSTTDRQSEVLFSKPNLCAASAAMESLTSTIVLRTGIAGAGQKTSAWPYMQVSALCP